jgi:alpha-N-arabinofuranosidase
MPDYLTCIMRSEGPEKMIAGVVAILADTGFRGRIKIAFDEWNLRGWHHPGFPRKQPVDPNDKAAAELVARREDNAIAKQYTMADALFAASFLNACLRHCEDVGMANIAPIINTRGPLYVHPEGIVKRTTFHALAMYANLLESRVGKLQVEAGPLVQGKGSIPVVDATATCDESGGKWAIALINRHPAKTAACTVRIGNLLPDGLYDATVLAGDSPEAYNDVEHPHRVAPEQKKVALARGVVNLPPHSLMVVHIAAK